MHYDPDEVTQPIRPRPARPRLVSMNDEHLAHGRAALLSSQGKDISMEQPLTLPPMPAICPMPEGDNDPTEPRIKSVRLKPSPTTAPNRPDTSQRDTGEDLSDAATINLKQLSGMMTAIRRLQIGRAS